MLFGILKTEAGTKNGVRGGIVWLGILKTETGTKSRETWTNYDSLS